MWQTLFGNKKLINNLKHLCECSRMPHAIILEGDDGIGKLSLARIIAAGAVCKSHSRPCGNCDICRLAAKGEFCDVSEFSPEKANYTIAQIREIRNKAFIMPNQSEKKVFILKHCDLLRPQAQNALLKIIEEPPSTTSFILLCKTSSSLLETIRSRCNIFTLSEPDFDSALLYLKSQGIADDIAQQAVTSAHCNIGKALRIVGDQSFLETNNIARQIIVSVERGAIFDALAACKSFERDRGKTKSVLLELRSLLFEAVKSSEFDIIGGTIKKSRLLIMIATVDDAIEYALSNANSALLGTWLCTQLSIN